MHGKGELIKLSEEQKFVGYFRKNRFHGFGRREIGEGASCVISQGVFEDGKLNGKAAIWYALLISMQVLYCLSIKFHSLRLLAAMETVMYTMVMSKMAFQTVTES